MIIPATLSTCIYTPELEGVSTLECLPPYGLTLTVPRHITPSRGTEPAVSA
jgi:hypothetical protein